MVLSPSVTEGLRLVTTTKDQSLGFICGLPLMVFGKIIL